MRIRSEGRCLPDRWSSIASSMWVPRRRRSAASAAISSREKYWTTGCDEVGSSEPPVAWEAKTKLTTPNPSVVRVHWYSPTRWSTSTTSPASSSASRSAASVRVSPTSGLPAGKLNRPRAEAFDSLTSRYRPPSSTTRLQQPTMTTGWVRGDASSTPMGVAGSGRGDVNDGVLEVPNRRRPGARPRTSPQRSPPGDRHRWRLSPGTSSKTASAVSSGAPM